jgi:aconitate hydratase
VKAVIVKSFARIHRANLINAGILPLEFANEADYDKINMNDTLELRGIAEAVKAGKSEFTLTDKDSGESFTVRSELSERGRDIMLAGGLLDYTREKLAK